MGFCRGKEGMYYKLEAVQTDALLGCEHLVVSWTKKKSKVCAQKQWNMLEEFMHAYKGACTKTATWQFDRIKIFIRPSHACLACFCFACMHAQMT